MRTIATTILCLLSVAQAAEKHPWASFKPGSYAKYKTTAAVGPSKTVTEMTQTLISVDGKTAVVEMETKAMGQTMKNRVNMPIEAGGTAPAQANVKPINPTNETVTVAGKSIAAKCYDSETNANGMKSSVHACMSETVPGGLVKSTSKTTGAVKMESVTELVEFAAK